MWYLFVSDPSVDVERITKWAPGADVQTEDVLLRERGPVTCYQANTLETAAGKSSDAAP